jgi:cytochrome P450
LPARGDLVGVRLGPVHAVVVCDPELTWQVLSHDRVFDKGGSFIERAREVVGDGLGTCPYSRHRRQRRLLQPAFHPDRIAGYAQVMTDRISAVTGSWRHGQILDVVAEMTTMTATTTAATLFTDTLPAPIPFGAGARKCIGDTFALTEATLALATITTHWHLQTLPDQQIRPALAAALRPKKLHMRTTARRSTHTPGGDPVGWAL